MTHNITIVLDLHFSSVCDKLNNMSSFQLNDIYNGKVGAAWGEPWRPPHATSFYFRFNVFR